MRKLLLLSILLLLVSIAVSAQYSSVDAPSCYDACKSNCMEEKRSGDECAKLCDVKCAPSRPSIAPVPISVRTAIAPLPPVQLDCGSQCKLDFDRCMKSGRSNTDCAKMYDMCSRKCTGAPEPRPSQNCESMCDQDYSKCKATGLNAVGAVGPECDQMRRACYKKCQPAVSPEVPCEAPCRKMLADCEQTPVMTNAMPDCKGMFVKCMADSCGEVQPPENCEDRCAKIRIECSAAGVDQASCEMKIKDCMRQCQPQQPCPPFRCEYQCTDSFSDCMKKASGLIDRPEGKDLLDRCHSFVQECLDKCVGAPRPMGCEDRCMIDEKTCLDQGNDRETCGRKAKYCVSECQPRPVEPTCEGKCRQLKDSCAKENVPDDVCAQRIRGCVQRCQPAPPQTCRAVCANRRKECGDSGIDASKCDEDEKRCLASCEQPAPAESYRYAKETKPEDLVGLNPQPEPPMPAPETQQISLLGRIWRIFTGG